MILAAAIFTAVIYGLAVWAWLFAPQWLDFEDGESIGIWYSTAWMVTLGAATIPTALLWTHL